MLVMATFTLTAYGDSTVSLGALIVMPMEGDVFADEAYIAQGIAPDSRARQRALLVLRVVTGMYGFHFAKVVFHVGVTERAVNPGHSIRKSTALLP